MKKIILTIHRITDSIETSVLQEMQDAFSTLGNVSMSIYDALGQRITQPSCIGPLCNLLQQSESGLQACAMDMQEAATTPSAGQTIAETCHAGLQRYVIPIEFDGIKLGSILVGDRPSTPLEDEPLDHLARQHSLAADAVRAAAGRIEPWADNQRQAAIRLATVLAKAVTRVCRQDIMIRNRVEELSAVYSMANMLSGTMDLKAALNAIAERITRVMQVKACAIRLLDPATRELRISAVYNLSDTYLNKGPVILGENDIDDAVFAGQTVYIADARTDTRLRYPEQAKQEGIVSGLCVAMTYRGRTVGVLRVYADRPYEFSSFEASLLRSIASQSAAAVVNAELYQQHREAERHQQQLKYAGEIQRRMIPLNPPPHATITFAGVYAPSLEVGGDFYDYLHLPNGNIGLCVADVVGKGVPAGLMMASVRSVLRGYAHGIYNLNEIVSMVNRHMERDTLSNEFATLFYGVFSPDGRRLTYCNAGHDPPLLLRGDTFTRLETGGIVIGVKADSRYEQGILELRPGDLLVFYTDGVVDALNFEGHSFGRQRLQDSIRKYSQEPPRELANQLLWDIRRYAGLAKQTDDLTIVVARVGPV